MLPWHPPPSLHVQQQQQGVSELNGVGEQPSNGNATNNNLTNGAGQPPMTLANVLHFLQSEHRRYARDRNEWEIERAEMRARIALLEGEKRGNEGALRDLGRRCRMLENALRGERSKQIQQLQQQQQQQQASSGTSSPAPPPAAAAASNPATTGGNANSRASSALGIHPNNPTTAPAAAPPAAGNTLGKDPRGRARSREYLKQCLQEITYLTSQTTLNPLSSASHLAPNVPRPKKVLPSLSEVGPGAQPTTATSSAPQPGIITLPPVVTAPSTTTSAAPGESSAYVPLKRQVSSPLTTSATNDHEQQATIPQTNPSEEDPTDPFIPRTEESLTSDVTTSEGTIVSEDHLVQQPWQYGSSIY